MYSQTRHVSTAHVERWRATRWRLARRSEVKAAFLLAPALVYLFVMFTWPVLRLLARSMWEEGGPTTTYYERVVTTELYRDVLLRTLRISLLVTVICLVLGYVMAYAMVTVLNRWTTVLLAVVVLSFWTSLLIRTYAWMVILGRRGFASSVLMWLGYDRPPQMLYNTFGAMVGMINVMLPYMVLTLYVVMRQVDPALMKAAASLGANPWRAFWRVFVPNTVSGIGAGCVLVFVITLGFFVTPALLGGPESRMLSQIIAELVQRLLNWELAAALSTVLIVSTLLVLYLYTRFVPTERREAQS